MKNKKINESDLDGIIAFGHDLENRVVAPVDKRNYSDGAYAPCHKCYAHFTPAEMGVMGSPTESCVHFAEWIQLCPSCMELEITRLSVTLGVPESKSTDSKWIVDNVLSWAKEGKIKEDAMSIEKLFFLLHAKNKKNA